MAKKEETRIMQNEGQHPFQHGFTSWQARNGNEVIVDNVILLDDLFRDKKTSWKPYSRCCDFMSLTRVVYQT